MIRHTNSAHATEALGKALALKLKGGETLALVGNLGTGKTTFVKGLAKGLKVKQTITSPTFVLMKVYKAKLGRIRQFVHVDCYRVPGVELSEIGLGDYLGQPDTVVAIEWAKKLPRLERDATTIAFIRPTERPNARRIAIKLAKRSKVSVQPKPNRRRPTARAKAARGKRTRQHLR